MTATTITAASHRSVPTPITVRIRVKAGGSGGSSRTGAAYAR